MTTKRLIVKTEHNSGYDTLADMLPNFCVLTFAESNISLLESVRKSIQTGALNKIGATEVVLKSPLAWDWYETVAEDMLVGPLLAVGDDIYIRQNDGAACSKKNSHHHIIELGVTVTEDGVMVKARNDKTGETFSSVLISFDYLENLFSDDLESEAAEPYVVTDKSDLSALGTFQPNIRSYTGLPPVPASAFTGETLPGPRSVDPTKSNIVALTNGENTRYALIDIDEKNITSYVYRFITDNAAKDYVDRVSDQLRDVDHICTFSDEPGGVIACTILDSSASEFLKTCFQHSPSYIDNGSKFTFESPRNLNENAHTARRKAALEAIRQAIPSLWPELLLDQDKPFDDVIKFPFGGIKVGLKLCEPSGQLSGSVLTRRDHYAYQVFVGDELILKSNIDNSNLLSVPRGASTKRVLQDIVSLLSMKPGDTDNEYFKDYSLRQLWFTSSVANMDFDITSDLEGGKFVIEGSRIVEVALVGNDQCAPTPDGDASQSLIRTMG